MSWRILTVALCAACASPREATLTIEDAEERLLGRAPEPELVASALELADLDALSLTPPTAAELADPGSDGYWHGAAYAFAAPVREARARALATLAREGSAGAPGPVGLRVMDHELGGDAALLEAVATFDLIGLLGLGPSTAARELARAESLRAVANLEVALWNARFDVDRARVDEAASYWLVGDLSLLMGEAQEDLPRVEILEEHGRLGEAAAAAVRSQVAGLRVAITRALEGSNAARARTLAAAGMLEGPIHEVAPIRVPEVDELPMLEVRDHPELRAARVALAVEEARLRAIAARAWPGLQAGPQLGFPEGGLDPLRLGGMLALTLPLPSSYAGALEAAAVERDRAVERYEERWLQLSTTLQESQRRARIAGGRLDAAKQMEQASAQAWSAARAAFRAGRVGAAEWRHALRGRIQALELVRAAERDVARGALDAYRAVGPRGGVR